MLKSLFEQQKAELDFFFQTIDVATAERVFEKILSCRGVVILSGVGKSGHIGKKISATLVSTGTRSTFLSPAHALHGDLGFASSDDIFLALSKSGESQELLDLVPHLRKKGVCIIAVVSEPHSRLEKQADLSILLPIRRELCPYNLAPTLSTTVQLLFGDALAIALMKAKQVSVADFAANHPAGFLGKKITLKVADLMLKGEEIPIASPRDRLLDVLHALSAKKCGCLLICDEKRQLKGIFTDGDLRRSIEAMGPSSLEKSVEELMTKAPMITSADRLAIEAMRQMEENRTRLITVLPVLEGEKVVGLLRMHDIIQAGLHSLKEK